MVPPVCIPPLAKQSLAKVPKCSLDCPIWEVETCSNYLWDKSKLSTHAQVAQYRSTATVGDWSYSTDRQRNYQKLSIGSWD